MKNLSIGLLVAFATTALSGCALYFGDDHDNGDTWTYCGSDGYYTCDGDNCQWVSSTCPDPGTGSGGGGQGGGFDCTDSTDCAAGCYCADGICEEAGFCTTDEDCGTGYVCNVERSSCEPSTCSCTTDAEAAAQGYGYCDELSGTCKNGSDPAGTCAGEPTCNLAPPVCQPGDVPLLGADGCWNGECEAASQCADAPSCSHINDQTNCSARSDCHSIVNGINCTKNDGTGPCQAGDTNCTCEQLVFAACAAN